jgi:hypothetical protein
MSLVLSILTHCILAAVVFATTRLPGLWKAVKPAKTDENEALEITKGNLSPREKLKSLRGDHELTWAFRELIERDGAGSWPPKASYDNWPIPLRPYKEIYFELAPLLPTPEPSLDDAVNMQRIEKYRSLMRKLLSDRIDRVKVEEILVAAEAGNSNDFSRDAYNGFYCAIALLRHAFRYGSGPASSQICSAKLIVPSDGVPFQW